MHKPASPAVSGSVVFAFVVVFVLAFAFVLLPPAAARAQEPAPAEDDRLTILITASRFAETADETLAPVTVITRRDIEEKQAETVEEVLRSVPGVTLANSGGVGQQTSLFLRGAESNHVLVLIDGVKVGSVSTGLTQFEHLPLDQIEKIEVVRGPRSSLYGSEAIGGVVQIFTRKGVRGTRPWFSASAGSHQARKVGIGLSGGGKTAWYHFGVSEQLTDGFDACRASFCIAERDDDGYDNASFSLRGGISPVTDFLDIEGRLLGSDNQTEFDGFYNETEHITRVGSLKATLKVSEQWRTSLLVGRSKDDLKSLSNGRFGNQFITTRDQINWQNDFRAGKHSEIIAGIDYSDDEASRTPGQYVEQSRDNIGVFALFRTERDANDFELSLRNDDDEQFGGESTGSVAWGRDIGAGKRITASYGTAFKAPTFGELYAPESVFGGATYGGNPDLEPETSKNFDIGFSHRDGDNTLSANAYLNEIDNLIATRQSGTNRRSMNIEEAEIRGIELAGETRISAWRISGALTWLDTEQTKGVNKGKQLLRRPREKLDLGFSRYFDKHLVGANIYAQGESEDFGGVDLAGFAIFNLRAELRLHKHWSLALKINNASDKEYQTVSGYPQDGRNYLATLRYIP